MNQTDVSSRNTLRIQEPSNRAAGRCGAVLLGLYVSFASFGNLAVAGPEGGQVVSGSGTISQSGHNTLINQGSQRLGLEWQTFNVGANESVVFDQPSSSAVAMNRIFDQSPSQIFGALDANGHVYLINPNGIVFGSSAVINVGALLASSLDINVNDFMAGNLDFKALGGEAGLVVNRGLITAATGGHVTLLGGSVANEGLIVADLGQVNLGAGARASLDFDGDGLLFFEVDDAVLNNSAQLESAVSNTGEIRADGGQVVLAAKTAQDVFANVVNNEGLIRASRIENSGGVVRLVGEGGTVLSSGTLDASGDTGTGGTVQVLGDRVGLFGDAVVDVSGDTDGGLAQIGGSFQGSDPSIANANRTFVGSDVAINADAGNVGGGGEVIIWADEVTRFYGEITARGGSVSGDGGFIETSGKSLLEYAGTVNASASNGAAGTWLLDPVNVEITAAAETNITQSGVNPINFDPATAPAPGGVNTTVVDVADVVGALDAGTSVVINTTALAGEPDATEAGDITVNAAIGKTAGGDATLTLNADNDILVNQSITSTTGALNVDLNATGDVVIDAVITTNNGTFNSDGVDFTQNQAITTGTGTIDVNHTGAVTVAAQIQTAGATVDIDGSTFDSSGFSIDTTGADNNPGGAVTITTTGQLTAGDITTSGGADAADATGQTAGDVVLTGGDVNVGAVTATGSAATTPGANPGGNGGALTVTSQGGVVLSGNIDTTGGAGTAAGTDGVINLLAGQAGGGSANAVSAGITLAGGATTFTGGAGADVFNLDADFGGTVNGGAGADDFNINVTQSGQLDGGEDSDTFTVAAAAALTFAGTAIDGGADAGGNDNDTLNIAANAGPLDVDLTGSTANTGFAGTETTIFTGVGGEFAGIDTITGSANDTLTGLGVASTWTQTTYNDGTEVLTFNGFGTAIAGAVGTQTLQGDDGGATADTFTTTGAGLVTLNGQDFQNIDALDGVNLGDTFNLNTADFGGNVAGGAGGDTFNVTVTQSGQLDGGAGDDTFNLTDGAAVGTLAGGANTDTLVSVDVGNTANTWVVTAPNQGTLNGQAFQTIENLTGNAEGDSFEIQAAGTLAGAIAGLGGADSLDISAPAAVTVNLQTSAATPLNGGAANGFSGIEAFTGNGTTDVLLGPNGGATFSTTGVNDGTVATFTFTDFANLTGGTGNDIFNLANNVTGTVDGGNDSDTFNLTDGVTVGTLTGGAGGADNDTLVSVDVGNTANTWVVNVADQGTLNGQAFQDMENLTGNAQADTFTFTAALTGNALGLGGNDSFNVNDGGAAGLFDGGANADTLSYAGRTGPVTIAVNTLTNMETLIGTAFADTLQGTAGVDTFTTTGVNAGMVVGVIDYQSFENLQGLGSADFFNLNNNVTGTVDGGDDGDTFNLLDGVTVGTLTGGAGGADSDTLVSIDVGNTANTWIVNNPDAGTLNGQAFNDIESLSGNAQIDTFTFTASLSGPVQGFGGADVFNLNADIGGFLTAGAGNDQINVNVSQSGALAGGANEDTFNLAANVSASLSGDAGTDTIVVASGTAVAFTVDNSDEGDVDTGTGLVSFTSVGNLIGSNQADSFDLGADLSGTASGGAGDDSYTLAAGVSATVAGGADADSLTSSNSGTTFTVNTLDQGTATDNAGGSVNFSSIESLAGGLGGDTFVLNADLSGTASGNAGDDTFDINANVTVDLLGGANDDEFILADGVTADGVVDGGAGNGDVLDFSEYTTARNVTLQGVGPNGFDGDEAALGSGFQNMNDIRGASSASSSLTALNQNATWQINGNAGNSYATAGETLAFDGAFAVIVAGAGADSFTLGTGIQTGNLSLDGGAGTDSATVGGNFDVIGTFTMSAIESLGDSGGELGGGGLRISGATGGIGSQNAPIATDLGTLEVLASGGGLYLVEADGLNVLGAAIGSSNAEITVTGGDLTIGLINAGAASPGSGTVLLTVNTGDLLSGNSPSETNISGRSATLQALQGSIGEENNRIVVEIDENATLTVVAAGDAFLNNINLAKLDVTRVVGLASEARRDRANATASVGAASAILDVAAIDWEALEIEGIVDTLDPPVRLPADQQFGDDDFAQSREANKLLLIRTSDGWKLIPVYVEATTAAN